MLPEARKGERCNPQPMRRVILVTLGGNFLQGVYAFHAAGDYLLPASLDVRGWLSSRRRAPVQRDETARR